MRGLPTRPQSVSVSSSLPAEIASSCGGVHSQVSATLQVSFHARVILDGAACQGKVGDVRDVLGVLGVVLVVPIVLRVLEKK